MHVDVAYSKVPKRRGSRRPSSANDMVGQRYDWKSEPDLSQFAVVSMLQSRQTALNSTPVHARNKNPLDFISAFFRKKNKRSPCRSNELNLMNNRVSDGASDDEESQPISSDDQTDSGISIRDVTDPFDTSMSLKNLNPHKLDVDMEHLRLSRHDNPVLIRHLSSSPQSFDTSTGSSICNEDQDTRQLMSSTDEGTEEDCHIKSTICSHMHEHLIRSPPPNPCSLPEKSSSSNVFVFPSVSKNGLQSRSLEPLPISVVPIERRVNKENMNLSKRTQLNPLQTKRGNEVIDESFRQILDAQCKVSDTPSCYRNSGSPLPNRQDTPVQRSANKPVKISGIGDAGNKLTTVRTLAPLKSKPN